MASSTTPPASPHRHTVRVLEFDSLQEIAREIERTESEPEGVALMAPKGRVYALRVEDVSLKAAPLLKQEFLAAGGDSAHARGIADHSAPATSAVLLATWAQYRRLLPKLARQPFRLRAIGEEVDHALRAYVRRGPRTVRGAHASLTLGDQPRVMGVVNVTPDSFSDGGQFLDAKLAIAHAEWLAAEGADVLDIGGESTRPGATPVSPEAEWRRVEPVLRGLAGRVSVPISIDTRHAEVAERAVNAGADLVNDVDGLRDDAMRRVVARTSAAVIVMHLRGTPATMQDDLQYADLRGEVYRWLAERTDAALADGIGEDRLLVDPGIGFGKSAEQSLELLTHAGEFRSLGYPVVVGASRKSFLGWAAGTKEPHERLEAGLAAAVLAAERGVELIRTHDVGPTVRALAVVAAARRGVTTWTDAPGEG
ncbi:MAG: dihydropteroate synthase [Thermoplasmata archaeon]